MFHIIDVIFITVIIVFSIYEHNKITKRIEHEVYKLKEQMKSLDIDTLRIGEYTTKEIHKINDSLSKISSNLLKK